jgi:nickel transport protein
MKKAAVLFSFFILYSSFCTAHDVQVAVELSSPTVITKSSYSGSEAMSYAAVLVFSPQDSKTEYQNGRSDAAGVFSFVPDRPGKWRFVIDDEMGHRVEKDIDVTAEFLKGSVKSGVSESLPAYWKILIGVSIIIGCTGILFWVKARKVLTGKKIK